MAKQSKRSGSVQEPRGIYILSGLLFLCAAAIALYLLWYSLTAKPMAGCGPGSPCDRVMGSPWAYWLNVPVTAPALAAYLALAFFAQRLASRASFEARVRAWRSIFILACVVLPAALWFVGLQLFVLKTFCKFCTTAHATSVLGIILLLRAAPFASKITPRSGAVPVFTKQFVMAALLIGAAGGVALIGGQKLAPHRTNIVRVHSGQFAFDLREVPLIGSPDSPKFIVSLFDYTCPDCHAMHHDLLAARDRLGKRFSVVTLPLPLEPQCNRVIVRAMPKHEHACEYARIGLAVRKAGQTQFQHYDDWFFAQSGIAKLEDARKKAGEIIGADVLARNLTDPWVDKMIETSVSIYEKNKQLTSSMRIPQLVIGDVVNIGLPAGLDELVTLLRSRLGLDY